MIVKGATVSWDANNDGKIDMKEAKDAMDGNADTMGMSQDVAGGAVKCTMSPNCLVDAVQVGKGEFKDWPEEKPGDWNQDAPHTSGYWMSPLLLSSHKHCTGEATHPAKAALGMRGMSVSSSPESRGENKKFRATWGEARDGTLRPGIGQKMN